MPAFGSNSITCKFIRKIRYEPVKGFRLSDRVVSALDRFIGDLTRFIIPGEPGVMKRWLFIYPFVGGKDWTHALNLADVGGNFEKFKLTWSGAMTHDQNGVNFDGGQGDTHCDMSDAYNNPEAWNRRSQGFYCRTNAALNDRTMSAGFTEPKNGYYYTTGIHAWWTDGRCYGDLIVHSSPSNVFGGNRNSTVMGDSLGLYSDNQRGPFYGVSHYMYKQAAYIAGDNTPEAGMGYGDGLGLAIMVIGGFRNISFVFSTKHPKVLEGSMNEDGSGGQMPGSNGEFYHFVDRFQVGLLRNV